MTTLYDFTVKDINNKEWDLSELKGKVIYTTILFS